MQTEWGCLYMVSLLGAPEEKFMHFKSGMMNCYMHAHLTEDAVDLHDY
jgi:hypothetical protein